MEKTTQEQNENLNNNNNKNRKQKTEPNKFWNEEYNDWTEKFNREFTWNLNK